MQVGNSKSARLIEVFSAIQGEALNIGTRQIFIRFAICDLRCSYCDSAHTWQMPVQIRVECTPGLRDFEFHANPVQVSDLLTWVERQNQSGLHDSISLTGGEPLLHAAFLREFLPEVRALTGLPVYLETGGHRPQELAMVLQDLDSVGMDIKLPSVSGESHWEAHRQFLQLCVDAQKEVFVKIIISEGTLREELEKAGELVGKVSEKVPVYLQPVTPLREEEKAKMKGQVSEKFLLAPSPEQVLEWQGLMKRYVKPVRVIPQTHKMLNQL